MPLRKIPINPGLNKNITATQAEGQWIDGDNIRFHYGSPEKIGGWEQIGFQLLVGAARANHTWFDLEGNRYAAIGTNKLLYIFYDEAFYDITPLGTALTSCTYTSTTGSKTVTINKASHNLNVGDIIIFTSVTTPGAPTTSFTSANFETNPFEVITVPTANTFTVTMPVTETGTGVTAGGTITTTPYVTVGPLISTFGYGWGAGTWGLSTWGTPRTVSNTDIDAGSWSLDNFGELLIATIRNNKTFKWDPNAGAGVSSRATVIPNNPTASVLTVVSDRDRHLIHLGTETTIGTPSTQDPMFIRFSDQEDLEDYVPTSVNTAGTFRIDNGSKIVTAVKAKDYVLVLTDEAAYTMQFVGPPITFSIRQVGSNCGCIGDHAAIFANGAVWWMGDSGSFFVYDGTVKQIPCSVEDFVFTTLNGNLGINFTNGELVYAGHNSLFSEIMWFYPKSGSNEVDRVVTFNFDENTWYTGSLSRTTYTDANVFENPRATRFYSDRAPTFPTINGVTNGASYYFEHEVGFDEVTNPTSNTVSTVAISAFVTSGDFDLDVEGDGEYFLSVKRFIPDFKNLVGNAKVTLQFKSYPADTTAAKGLVTKGPFSVTTSTDKVDMRARGRQANIKIECDSVNENWRYGLFRVDVQPDGRR